MSQWSRRMKKEARNRRRSMESAQPCVSGQITPDVKVAGAPPNSLFGLNGNRMDYEAEPSDVVPTRISPPAWEAAMTIMEEVDKLHKEAGFIRRDGYSKSTEIAAKMVQLAINKFFAHNTGALEGER